MTSIPFDRSYRRSGRGLLFASLALNLFCLGLLGAVAFNMLTSKGIPIDRSPAGRIARLAYNLPPADGDVLRKALAEAQPTADKAYRQLEADWARAREILGRTPFDQAAAEAAMAQATQDKMALDSILHRVVAIGASRMSPQGRAVLATYRPVIHKR